MSYELQHEVTQILHEWSNGDGDAPARLMPFVYDELRRQARNYLAKERGSHTLQPTALVHEAYLRLVDQTRISWQNRAHFYGMAANMMRRVLVDHARAHATEKRGGAAVRLSLEDVQVPLEQRAADFVALDEALEELAKFDERKARIVEMRFFGGLTDEEIAEVLGVTSRTVWRDWKTARLWLYRELSEPPAVAGGLADCGFGIWDCGLVVSAEVNPKSQIRNPKSFCPPATAGGSDCQFFSKNLALDYMNPENWLKVEELLNAALEIEPSKRRKFLDEIGADGLRREVESLLDAEQPSEKFLASSAVAFSADFFDQENEATGAHINQKIGNYRIIRELGRGGMGAIYLGERTDGKFSQQVAFKLLKRELNTADIRRRFRHERQILAALAHPNIARLLDAGTTDDGLPFLVMEYVEGLPVDEFCNARNLDLNERLEIFRMICDAVAFAHRNLIVHRDLKPSNILLTTDGIPKLLDFGISKLLTPEYESESEHTVTKLGAMTPEYASPEQLRGESVTTATDVYSLGVILYELLTTHRPFHFKKYSAEEIIQAVCNTEPRPPSAALNAERGMRNAELKNDFPANDKSRTNRNKHKTTPHSAFRIPHSGDLDNIVLKSLKKEPHRRYSSVEQFAEDIRRHLADLPVLARPDTPLYRATKFINRNRIAVLAVLLIFLSLLGGVVATVWQARRAEASQARAEKRFNDVRRLSNALLFELSPKIERLQGATEAREILVNRALEYLDSLAQEAEGDLQLQSELASAYEKIGDLQGNPANPNFIDSGKAIESYEKARVIRLNLLEKNPSDSEQQRFLAENRRISGVIYGQASDYETELKNLEAALAIYEKQVAEESESNELKFALAQINYDIGKNRFTTKRYADSFLYFENAIASLEKLRQQNPNQVNVLKLLGDCHNQYALALSWEERQKEAETELAKAIELFEAAVASNPNDINLRTGLWSAHWFATSIYEEVDDARAHEHALKALKIAEEIVRQDAANIRAKQQLSKSFSHLGQTSINTGKPAEAILFLEKARASLQEVTESRSKNKGLKTDLTIIFMRLGEAKSKQENFEDALADFEQAVKIHQDVLQNFAGDNRTYRNLAMTYESIAETHEKIAGRETSEKSRTAREAAKNYFQKTLDILLQLDAENALSEFDRKFIEKTKVAVEKYGREQ